MLSEGEQRVVAVAYFLAEARMAPDKVGVIFDDPVSSLDHRWAERLAARLAQFARDRQVIVFTHSIAFLIELERCATEAQVPIKKAYITRSKTGAGRCAPDAEPWERLNVRERIEQFKKTIADLRTKHATAPMSRDYAREATNLCSDLRAAWERAVEESVVNRAIERFGYAVSTGRLKRAICTDTSFKMINDAMTRLSVYTPAHDKGPGAFSSCPTPTELDSFLKALDEFLTYQKKEAKVAEKNRELLENPPLSAAAAGGTPSGSPIT